MEKELEKHYQPQSNPYTLRVVINLSERELTSEEIYINYAGR